jgi:hypothetical protein
VSNKPIYTVRMNPKRINQNAMKIIRVQRTGSTYRANVTTTDGPAKTVLCRGSEQLTATLATWGASPTGIFDIFTELESSRDAELRLPED